MSVPPKDARIVCFGGFELDLKTGELRKGGVKLRLQGQPFQVLATLVERPGIIITRDELREKLWPSDTFVDFDHSLNTAINKVRDVLGDSASAPRYVETLTRRGYRFVAPVETLPSATGSKSEIEASLAGAQGPPRRETSPGIHPELQIPIPNRSVTRGLFSLIQLMYLVFYSAALLRLRAVEGIVDSVISPRLANTLIAAIMVTAGIGIPVRCYLISSAGFDYQRMAETFRRIFAIVLVLDGLWAIAPFLLMRQIGVGGAFAASAALLYVPFSERTLIRMAYLGKPRP